MLTSVLLGVILWIVLSYVPASLVSLPEVSIQAVAANALFRRITVIGLIVFVALQVWLLISTMHIFRSGDERKEVAEGEFHLRRPAEFFWTVVPLIMTLALALATLPTWMSLNSP